MKKDFKKWHTKKEKLNDTGALALFQEREVWWCVLGVNIGSEEDGKGKNYLRPVLILRKFNKSVFYGLPVTSKVKDDQFHVSINSGEIKGSIILSQMRLIDSKRLSHLAGKITDDGLKDIKKKLKNLFP